MSADTQHALHEAITAHFADEGITFEALRGVNLMLVVDGFAYHGRPEPDNTRALYCNAEDVEGYYALAAPDHPRGTAAVPQLRNHTMHA